jgi:hypothetical protein
MRRLPKTVLSSGLTDRLPALFKACPLILAMAYPGPSVHGQDDIPTGFKVDRYQKIWERNPFTLVTPVAQQVQPTVFDKLALVSWMKAGSKDVVLVQNTENNEVQKVTKEPNSNNLRLVELHPNQNPQMVEAILSDGKDQGSVKFKMDAPPAAQPGVQPMAPTAAMGPVNPAGQVNAVGPMTPQQYAPVQLPTGMAPSTESNQMPRPGQAPRQQGQENASLPVPNQPMPGAPSHPGEIRRKRLAPPNAN